MRPLPCLLRLRHAAWQVVIPLISSLSFSAKVPSFLRQADHCLIGSCELFAPKQQIETI